MNLIHLATWTAAYLDVSWDYSDAGATRGNILELRSRLKEMTMDDDGDDGDDVLEVKGFMMVYGQLVPGGGL